MTFNEYQEKALDTIISTNDDFKDTLHWVLGINGEAGEVAEKIKKIIRDQNSFITQKDKQELVKELGDVLWYLAVFAKQLGYSFDEVANSNLKKLSSRKNRGVLGGSGDNR
jgi:NTP pyrophosphatase (non-canonical NTP hydrolase)